MSHQGRFKCFLEGGELLPFEWGAFWVSANCIVRCMFTAEHGRKIGWDPMYPPQHILDVADDEVALIMKGLEGGNKRPDIR